MARNHSLSKQEIVGRFISTHGEEYNYSEVVYTNKRTKVTIICKEHGPFQCLPDNHINGSGCDKCSKIKKKENYISKLPKKIKFDKIIGKKLYQDQVLDRFNKTHGDKYIYSEVNYIKNDIPVTIICKEHGPFEQNPILHWNGSGCPECNGGLKLSLEKVLDRFNKTHGDKYIYSEVNYIKNDIPVTIICKEHGPFEQNPYNHWNGSGCPECIKNCNSQEDIINRLNDYNPYNHNFSKVQYKTMHEKVTIICKEHGPFERTLANYFTNYLCPKCNPNKSKYELELEELLKSLNLTITLNTKKIIEPYEIDLFLDDYKIGIEFNGVMFHTYGKSDFSLFNNYKSLDKNKHLKKTVLMEDIGYQLLHINEYDWKNPIKKEIWKSIINSKINKSEKFYARKFKVIDISENYDLVKNILDNNHMQGYCNYEFAYGLIDLNNQIYSIMTFGKSRFDINIEYELLRFCNVKNYSVIGGASKLLKHFENVNKPKSIISYAKRDWSQGNLYNNLGFNFSHNTEPSIFWYDPIKNKLYSRQKFQKYKLPGLFESGFLKTLEGNTAQDIMFNNGYRIYFDSGNKVYKKDKI